MKFGRKPALFNHRALRTAVVMSCHLDPLGPAPDASNDYVSAVTRRVPLGWGMLGNDQVGDCTCADTGHQVMLHTANAGPLVVPTTPDVVSLYSAITGYDPNDPSTDQGANETTVIDYLKSTGFLGQKVDDAANVAPQQFHHVRWAVQIFGAVRLGINLPQSFMDQFNANQPFDNVGDTNIVGGHDVPIVKYDPDYVYVVTWGELRPMTWRFLENSAYVEEAHAELWYDWVASQGTAPSGFDLAQLAADLRAIG